VRLRAGFSPPHWQRTAGPHDKWDAGYQTTAYFLAWLEGRYGEGTVQELNAALRPRGEEDEDEGGGAWDEAIFKQLTGRPIKKLWRMYAAEVGGGTSEPRDKEGVDEGTVG
jgi:hypothetical protein